MEDALEELRNQLVFVVTRLKEELDLDFETIFNECSFSCILVDPTVFDISQIASIEGNAIRMIPPYTGIQYFQPPEPPISSDRLEKARLLNASHSTKDGALIYRYKIDTWEYSVWKDNEYGSWWQITELPKGLVSI